MAQQNQNNGEYIKHRKIFVGGLAWSTTTDSLKEFCEQYYGPVVDANVVTHNHQGLIRSKGYGFVLFRDVESANKACEKSPIIQGRQTNINMAYVRAKPKANQNGSYVAPSQFQQTPQFVTSYDPFFWDPRITGPYVHVNPYYNYPYHMPMYYPYPTYGMQQSFYQPNYPHAAPYMYPGSMVRLENIDATNQDIVAITDVAQNDHSDVEVAVDVLYNDNDNEEETVTEPSKSDAKVAVDVLYNDNEEETVTKPSKSDADQEEIGQESIVN